MLNRRQFLGASAGLLAAKGAEPDKGRVALVTSSHPSLLKPSSIDDPLDYLRVREMVWKAIEYGRPRAGSLEAKIKPGSWVVIKPNIVGLPPRPTYRTGDVTDLRVTKAVLEYVAAKSRAARITIAEGGSYRRIGDPLPDSVMRQNGVQVDALTADWGNEFPGLKSTLGGILEEARAQFPAKRFDYIDLAYDALRDENGEFRWIEVPRSRNGIGAFSPKKTYVPSRTILDCDFLITVPVMKVHLTCGITACLKNYVGTAPRIVYARPGAFSNMRLHTDCSLQDRFDSFIVDLAAFHPPDYCVVDAIRGLQYSEHRIDREDQEVRSNLVLAGEDPVATDALAAHLMGFLPTDMEFLHMAALRQMGTFDLRNVTVVGDEPEKSRRMWGKPRNWHGRCNREWLVTQDPTAEMKAWSRVTAAGDTLHLADRLKQDSETPLYRAAVRVVAEGYRKAFLWIGAAGRVTAHLNGEKVLEEEGITRYRVGQFQTPVELRPGENLLVCELKPLSGRAALSALLVNPRNDGDSVDGIRWMA
jgi:uncharacterized protein (DUF362 family)